MKFIVSLCFFELFVVLGALLAHEDGYLTMRQAMRKRHASGKTVAVWIEHLGMWGDAFIVSPICAFIIWRYCETWDSGAMAISFGVSLVIGIVLVSMWRKGSKNLDESLARDGKITHAGWFHALYMIAAFFVLILFFIFTPSSVIAGKPIGVISVLMMVHVFLGFICPEWHTYKKVSMPTILLTISIWVAIAARWIAIANN